MKKQVIIIHGGDSFDSYDEYIDSLKNWEVSINSFMLWKDWKMNLPEELGDDFQVLSPRMPNKQNAKYEEWKIWFERMIPFVQEGVIFVGHSLGGIFLVRYLSENDFPRKVSKLLLVAAPHNQTPETGSFRLSESLDKVQQQCQNIHLFQSEDDLIVPPDEARIYEKEWPKSQLHLFQDRGHFNQETFPEIVEEIKR